MLKRMKINFGGAGRGGSGGMQLRSSLRTIQRSVRAGGGGAGDELEDSFCQSNFGNNRKSFSSTSTIPSLSSSFSHLPLPVSPNWLTSSTHEFESEWEYVNDIQDKNFHNDDIVFGFVPSKDEAESVVFAIQEFLKAGDVSERDEVEPSLQIQSNGNEDVHDAFHLLQSEPCVQVTLTNKFYDIKQKMVISLSTDKAVWDAVMNNEVVKELRASLMEDGTAITSRSIPITGKKDSKNAAMEILSRILFNTKAKMVELIEKITGLVYNMFTEQKMTEEGITMDPFQKKLKTSFLLSVVVFLIVAISRSRQA